MTTTARRVVDIAHGRSGDKGDTCNVGLVAYDDAGYEVLLREVTEERVAAHFGDLVKGTVTRYELPGIKAAELRADRRPRRWWHPVAALGPSRQGDVRLAAADGAPEWVTPSSALGAGSLAVLTLNRPEARNPLDAELSAALLDAMGEAMADDGVRSVAIAANGPAFCAGGDLRQMKEFARSSGRGRLCLAAVDRRPTQAGARGAEATGCAGRRPGVRRRYGPGGPVRRAPRDAEGPLLDAGGPDRASSR